jgi:hypothetical protein
MSVHLHAGPIPPTTPTSHLFQVLHQNLQVACQAKDAALCLRVIFSLLRKFPQCSLALIDQFCEQRQLPLLIVANTVDKWNPQEHICIDMQDSVHECPYFVQVYIVPRNRISATLARFLLDKTRPQWTRTVGLNQLYLDKCGLLVSRSQLNDMHRDQVMMGQVQLSIFAKK